MCKKYMIPLTQTRKHWNFRIHSFSIFQVIALRNVLFINRKDNRTAKN